MRAIVVHVLASALAAAVVQVVGVVAWWFILWEIRAPDGFMIRAFYCLAFAYYLGVQPLAAER